MGVRLNHEAIGKRLFRELMELYDLNPVGDRLTADQATDVAQVIATLAAYLSSKAADPETFAGAIIVTIVRVLDDITRQTLAS